MEINRLEMGSKSRNNFCRETKGNFIGNKKCIKIYAKNTSMIYKVSHLDRRPIIHK